MRNRALQGLYSFGLLKIHDLFQVFHDKMFSFYSVKMYGMKICFLVPFHFLVFFVVVVFCLFVCLFVVVVVFYCSLSSFFYSLKECVLSDFLHKHHSMTRNN